MTVARLLEPFSFSEFRDAYYEKQTLLIKRQSPAWYEDLLTLDDINQCLGETLFRYEEIRLVRAGKELDEKDYMYEKDPTHVDKEVLFAKFYEGYTVVLSQYYSSAMLRLLHDLERAFHGSANVHIYLTPRSAQGFSPHWDVHDTFILQFTGPKDWLIYDSPVILPTLRQPFRQDEWTKIEPTLTVTLEPGDLLYIPRGFVHEARSADAVSGHATIGLNTYTYASLLRKIADNAHADPWLRRSLPADFESISANDEFLRHVHQFFDNADLPAVVKRMHRSYADDRVPETKDRLADYVKLTSIGASSRLRMRSIVCHELTADGDQAVRAFHKKS